MYDCAMAHPHRKRRVNATRLRFFVLFVLLATKPALAEDFTAYAVLTTDYVKRGVSQSNSDPAIQLGVDLAFDIGLYTGLWASTVDISNGPERQRDLELNYYFGYGMDAGSNWRLGANLVFYTYPGATGNIDYDYEEFVLSAAFDDNLWFEYSYSPDLYDSGQATHNVELFGEWTLARHYDVSAGIGYYDTSSLTGTGYGYWQLGVARSFRWVDLDLRYHDTNRWIPIISTNARAGSRVVFSVRFVY